jgi:adenylate kinase
MHRVVVVTGMPGVGKSTVLGKALERLRKGGTGLRLVNYGDVMFEIAKGYGVEKRDDVRRLPGERQREIQKKAGRKIAGIEEDVIVDTHCTIKTQEGYLPGLPQWVLEELKPTQLVLIEAETEMITKRRRSDKSRDRDAEFVHEIEEHQAMNRAIAMSYASLTGATVKIIENRQDEIDKAVDELVEVLR